MSALPTPLPAGKLLIAVLHIISPPGSDGSCSAITSHVLAQARIAVDNGADGVALCPAEPHPTPTSLAVAAAVADAFPRVPLLINFMAPVAEALESVPAFAHLWTDEGVDGRGEDANVSAVLAASPLATRREGWTGTWLAGFFHKGSNQRDLSSLSDDALAAAVSSVAALSDVPVTSGAGAGVPPVAEELARLCKALYTSTTNITRLATASGVTIENVHALLPYVDLFLVATGIEHIASDPQTRASPAVEIGFLDPAKVRELAAAIHGYTSVKVGLIADIQYSTHDDLYFEEGQIAWGKSSPWPLVYAWPSTRRYRHSLEVLERSVAVWRRWGVTEAVVLGDILDKTTLGCRCRLVTPSCHSRRAANEVDVCVNAIKAALGHGRTYHFLFGNGDAQILKRRGWVEHGFAHGFERPELHPLRTASSLYYSTSPAPGARFIFLDTYDCADGKPGAASPQAGGAVECEASSDATWALAITHLATNTFVDGDWGEENWRKYLTHFRGDAHAEAEAYATQRYNGGIGPHQLQWLEQELTSACADGQAVFVFGHCPAHPFSCKPDGVMWHSSVLRSLFNRFSCVQAYIAGHDHDGGYVFEGGVHYIVPPAPLESQEDECFGNIALAVDSWRLEWWGKTPQRGCGTLRSGEWPSWKQLPFRGARGPAVGGNSGVATE